MAKTDVPRSAQVQSCLRTVIQRFKRIHFLGNNADINIACPVEQFSDEDWRRIMGINLDGVWFFCRYTIPHFLERGGGVIVNIASVGAFQALHDRAPHMASKGGVVNLTQALALDFEDRGIRVNAIGPGVIETSMGKAWRSSAANRRSVEFLTPMGRFGQPQEIADAAVFLASEESSYINGHTLVVDGAFFAGNRFGRENLWKTFRE